MFHQDIHTTITELAMMMRPTPVVLDATTTMMTNGPTGGSLGDLKATDLMIVSTDQVAADAFGCTLLERPLAALAVAGGQVQLDFRPFEIVTLRLRLA